MADQPVKARLDQESASAAGAPVLAPDPGQSEQNVYADVYRVLLAGMLASTVLFTVGMVLALRHPHYVPLTSDWIRQHYPRAVAMRQLLAGRPGVIMMLGTLVLILTPVARVLLSIYAFYVDGDRKYVAVTTFVFLVMVLTAVLGYLGLR